MKPTRCLTPLSEAETAHFWSRVDAGRPDECWPWRSARTGHYGQFSYQGVTNLVAHRVAYFLATSIDPADLLVCHHCDNPQCCNPAHLFLGDYAANKRDCMAKGRHANGKAVAQNRVLPCGDDHPRRKHPESWTNAKSIALQYADPLFNRGERNGRAKLTPDDVREIRRLHKGGMPCSALASAYPVNAVAISRIVRRVTWAHIP